MKIVLAALALGVALLLLRRWRTGALRHRRERVIDNHRFHPAMINKFRDVRPDLGEAKEALVFQALRDYFHLCLRTGGREMVSMPSQVVDDAWHAFILYTRGYQAFCDAAFGRFLHHTPAEAMKGPQKAQRGIKLAWRLACEREGINPRKPHRMPLLFAIDRELEIANGFLYVMNCDTPQRQGDGSYCASHIGCGGGGDSGNGDTSHGDGDGGGDGGCGGGCGGD